VSKRIIAFASVVNMLEHITLPILLLSIFGEILITTTVNADDTSLFNDEMILPVNRDNDHINPYDQTSILGLEQQQQQQQVSISAPHALHHVRSRSLFLFGTATGSICSLTSDNYTFIQDPISNLYYWDGNHTDISYHNIHSIWDTTILQHWNHTKEIQARYNSTQNNNSTITIKRVTVRACLCTQYLQRPIEFCSAEYYSCSVRTNPVTCFTISSTDTFIQSFWPVIVFWMLVVIYVWTCSDPGRIARQYYYRKFRCCHQYESNANTTTATTTSPTIPPSTPDHGPSTVNTNTEQSTTPTNTTTQTRTRLSEDQILQQQLDYLIEFNPSRVSNILRERMFRIRRQERYEQNIQNICWFRYYQQCIHILFYPCTFIWKYIFRCSNHDENDIYDNNNDNSIPTTNNENLIRMTTDEIPLQLPRPPSPSRLILKTKVYNETVTSLTLQEHPMNRNSTLEQQLPSLSTNNNDFNETLGELEHTMSEVDGTVRCAICLLPLQHGIDIIGDIPCNHCMHKHCLKEWLIRKNRCPLCQLSNIATYIQPPHNLESSPVQHQSTNTE
jgi:hypothetical protein